MKAELASWDGKSAAYLRAVYARRFEWERTLALCDDADVARAASWLMKHHVERAELSSAQVQALLNAQRHDAQWDVILHLVQILDRVALEGCDATHAVAVLQRTRVHDAQFVRAWSLSALARIAHAHPIYQDEVRIHVQRALDQERKPSVLARVRKAAALLGMHGPDQS